MNLKFSDAILTNYSNQLIEFVVKVYKLLKATTIFFDTFLDMAIYVCHLIVMECVADGKACYAVDQDDPNVKHTNLMLSFKKNLKL
ncbi:hypothetical protein EBU95_02225 [bacterium]|nr:hypothetical protein [bacterium]